MFKLCNECFEVYDSYYIKDNENGFNRCPKYNCYGEVFDIDELMIPTIIELNKKGYITEYCCSGHSIEKRILTYIVISDIINFKKLPENFDVEYDSYNGRNRTTIRYNYNLTKNSDLTPQENLNKICKINNDLLDWAISLEENSD